MWWWINAECGYIRQFLCGKCVGDHHVRTKPKILYFAVLEDAVEVQKVKSRNRCTQMHIVLNFKDSLTCGKTLKKKFGGHQELPCKYFVYLPALQTALRSCSVVRLVVQECWTKLSSEIFDPILFLHSVGWKTPKGCSCWEYIKCGEQRICSVNVFYMSLRSWFHSCSQKKSCLLYSLKNFHSCY